MRVFVLCTGRCGSTTFGEALRHCTNYTSAHESQTHLLGPKRLAFPDQHIEIDNRLSWTLGRLDQVHGDAPFYVHLLRDPDAVAKSFTARHQRGLMKGWREGFLAQHHRRHPNAPVVQVARELVDTVTENIQHFLKDKTKTMTVHLETVTQDFPAFWQAIGAQGDLAAAMDAWTIHHNATR